MKTRTILLLALLLFLKFTSSYDINVESDRENTVPTPYEPVNEQQQPTESSLSSSDIETSEKQAPLNPEPKQEIREYASETEETEGTVARSESTSGYLHTFGIRTDEFEPDITVISIADLDYHIFNTKLGLYRTVVFFQTHDDQTNIPDYLLRGADKHEFSSRKNSGIEFLYMRLNETTDLSKFNIPKVTENSVYLITRIGEYKFEEALDYEQSGEQLFDWIYFHSLSLLEHIVESFECTAFLANYYPSKEKLIVFLDEDEKSKIIAQNFTDLVFTEVFKGIGINRVAFSHDPYLCTENDFKENTAYFQDRHGNFHELRGFEKNLTKLVEFVVMKCLEPVETLDDWSYRRALIPDKLLVTIIDLKSDNSKLFEDIHTVASMIRDREQKDKIPAHQFLLVPFESQNSYILKYFGESITVADLPLLFLAKSDRLLDLKEKYLYQKKDITKAGIAEFLNQYENGELKKFYKSQRIPEILTYPVKLTASNFEDVVINSDDDYLVLFCIERRRKKCQALRYAFQEISGWISLTEMPRLRLATYDVERNELPSLANISIPHVRAYQSGKKNEPKVLYSSVTYSSIANFIKSLYPQHIKLSSQIIKEKRARLLVVLESMLFPGEKVDLEERSSYDPSVLDEDFEMKESNIILNGKFIDPIEGYKLSEAFSLAEQIKAYAEYTKQNTKGRRPRPDYDFSQFDEGSKGFDEENKGRGSTEEKKAEEIRGSAEENREDDEKNKEGDAESRGRDEENKEAEGGSTREKGKPITESAVPYTEEL